VVVPHGILVGLIFFFPFQDKAKINPYCIPYSDDNDYVKIGLTYADKIQGLDVDNVPIGLATAPVTWMYYNEQIPLKFVAGFMGAKQNPKTLEIEANIGWFIGNAKKEKENEQEEIW